MHRDQPLVADREPAVARDPREGPFHHPAMTAQSLRVQLERTGVTVVEFAPPGVETPLFWGELAEEFRGQKAMDVKDLVRHAIAGIEKGALEIRPGIANVLRMMSRVAPGFILSQMAGLSKRKG